VQSVAVVQLRDSPGEFWTKFSFFEVVSVGWFKDLTSVLAE